MGYDLTNHAGQQFRFNMTGWSKLFDLAVEFGWHPAGTKAENWIDAQTGEVVRDYSDWDGSYFYNEYQYVTSEDASALAAALERALPNLPNVDMHEATTRSDLDAQRMNALMADMGLRVANGDLKPVQYFSGPLKGKIQRFIYFCKAGSFTIG